MKIMPYVLGAALLTGCAAFKAEVQKPKTYCESMLEQNKELVGCQESIQYLFIKEDAKKETTKGN